MSIDQDSPPVSKDYIPKHFASSVSSAPIGGEQPNDTEAMGEFYEDTESGQDVPKTDGLRRATRATGHQVEQELSEPAGDGRRSQRRRLVALTAATALTAAVIGGVVATRKGSSSKVAAQAPGISAKSQAPPSTAATPERVQPGEYTTGVLDLTTIKPDQPFTPLVRPNGETIRVPDQAISTDPTSLAKVALAKFAAAMTIGPSAYGVFSTDLEVQQQVVDHIRNAIGLTATIEQGDPAKNIAPNPNEQLVIFDSKADPATFISSPYAGNTLITASGGKIFVRMYGAAPTQDNTWQGLAARDGRGVPPQYIMDKSSFTYDHLGNIVGANIHVTENPSYALYAAAHPASPPSPAK